MKPLRIIDIHGSSHSSYWDSASRSLEPLEDSHDAAGRPIRNGDGELNNKWEEKLELR